MTERIDMGAKPAGWSDSAWLERCEYVCGVVPRPSPAADEWDRRRAAARAAMEMRVNVHRFFSRNVVSAAVRDDLERTQR